jgi:hypothetical protein
MRDRGLDEIKRRAQIDGERPLPIGGAHLVRIAHDDDAGDIAQRIQSAEGCNRGRNGRGAIIAYAQIRRVDERAYSERAQLTGRVFETRDIEIDDTHVGAGASECERCSATQS